MTRLNPPSWLRPFEPGRAERMQDPNEVGEWGVRLAAMCKLGLPVPIGFVLSRGLFRQIQRTRQIPGSFRLIAETALAAGAAGRLRNPHHPLLLSLTAEGENGESRSFVGIGLDHTTIDGFLRRTGNPRYAWEMYRQLIATLGTALFGIDPDVFDGIIAQQRREDGIPQSTPLDADALRQVVRRTLWAYEIRTGRPFPDDPMEQLEQLVLALTMPPGDHAPYASSLPSSAAIIVQAMVFGNTGARSGSGVAYTRDPVTGENDLVVDFLFNGACDELSYGNRAPEIGGHAPVDLPWVQHVLGMVRPHIEKRFGDMQEIQFVVEDGALYAMRSRSGSRSPGAALRIALDQVKEGIIKQGHALELLSNLSLEQLRHESIDDAAAYRPLSVYRSTAAGVATGALALSSRAALDHHHHGRPVILAYDELNFDDVAGLAVARGVLTAGGGLSTRIASRARQLGLPCLITRADLSIDHSASTVRIGDHVLREGETLTIDGNTAHVHAGELEVRKGDLPEELEIIRRWLIEENVSGHPLA